MDIMSAKTAKGIPQKTFVLLLLKSLYFLSLVFFFAMLLYVSDFAGKPESQVATWVIDVSVKCASRLFLNDYPAGVF